MRSLLCAPSTVFYYLDIQVLFTLFHIHSFNGCKRKANLDKLFMSDPLHSCPFTRKDKKKENRFIVSLSLLSVLGYLHRKWICFFIDFEVGVCWLNDLYLYSFCYHGLVFVLFFLPLVSRMFCWILAIT